MTHKAAIAAAVLSVASTPVWAQGVTGGQVGIEYSAPTDGSDFGGTTYSGGLEFAINRQFAISVDASGYKPDNFDTAGSNLTLHGIYHLNDAASVGLFYGQDSADADDSKIDIIGLEGGTELNGALVSGYIGQTDNGSDTSSMFGADAAYALQNGFSVIGDVDILSGDALDASRISIGGQYEIKNGPQFYLEVGNASAQDVDQTFIGVGARVAFGAARGTTFDGRSSFDAIAGY